MESDKRAKAYDVVEQGAIHDQTVLATLCTVPSKEVGRTIASELVKNGLAACVNIIPAVESIYVWEGKVENDAESLLIIKTTRGRF